MKFETKKIYRTENQISYYIQPLFEASFSDANTKKLEQHIYEENQ